jgi:hypothetical protein
MTDAEQLIDQYLEAVDMPYTGAVHPLIPELRRPRKRKQRKEVFGLAGLPVGVRKDPESPNSYDGVT